MSRDKLASRVFLILHDQFSGKPLLRPTAVKIAVAGAELAELTLAHRIGMENDRIVVADARPRKLDHVSTFVIDSIRSQRDSHTVPVWLAALAERLFDLVATQLVDEGVVHRQRGGVLLGRSATRFPAADLLAASGPRVRLEHVLRTPRELDPASAAVAAVLGAVGAERVLDPDGDRGAVRNVIASATAGLTVDLRSLVMGIEVAHASGELRPTLRPRD
jgi:hypothetical protein